MAEEASVTATGTEPSGFAVPEGWRAERAAESTTLFCPEGDLKIIFVTLEYGASVSETALAAWRVIDPAFASKLLRDVEAPAQDGWEAVHQLIYEVPAKESRMEIAIVRKFGSRAFVNLVDGTTAAISRRGAQLSEAFGSWKSPGYKKVNLQGAAVSAWTGDQSRVLKEFILGAMKAMQIPGVSLAMVQGGRVVYADAMGVRSLDDEAPVTLQTRFMIGSTTKPLTTLLMAKLIDEKRLDWSTRVVDLLPDFALADAEMTNRLEIKHTASASTGMPRQDTEFVFKYSGITPEERIAQMKTMRPTTGFGETFQYSNVLVSAGGYAAARAFTSEGSLEEAFDRAFRETVLVPLKMTDTFLRQADAVKGEAAMPHATNFEGDTGRIPLSMEMCVAAVAPAGAAWSTAPDLARYVMLELGNGKMPEGECIISEEILLERRKKGIKIDEDSSYGLGLIISDVFGLRVIHHGGNTLGFTADLFFVPEKDFGMVVLTNVHQANGFHGAIREKVFEMAFGAEPRADKSIAAIVKMRQDGAALIQKKTITDPASMEWVSELVGRYHSLELGSLTISRREDCFWVECEEWGSAIGSEIQASGDRLLRLVSPPWRGGLKMLAGEDGTLLLDAGQNKYVFRRE